MVQTICTIDWHFLRKKKIYLTAYPKPPPLKKKKQKTPLGIYLNEPRTAIQTTGTQILIAALFTIAQR